MTDIPANITTKAELEGVVEFGAFSGALETPGDHDWIRVILNPGPTYGFYLSFLNTGSVIGGDAFLALRDADGNVVVSNDDGGASLNSFLSISVGSGGVFFLDVGEVADNNIGDYSLLSAQIVTTNNKKLTDDNDNYTGALNDRILGGKGADTINIGGGTDALGDQGNDVIIGNALSNNISGGLGNDTIDGGADDDTLWGEAGNDDLFGGDDTDNIFGGPGDDHLYGEAGHDFLLGGGGKDFLIGGAGFDVFYFDSVAGSKKGAARDVIVDFAGAGEVINVEGIDAKKGGADNAFHFIGMAKFHDKAGELRYVKHDVAATVNDKTIIQGDVNGDGKADFEIELTGLHTLTAGLIAL